MIINKLWLENFGLFPNKQEINLQPQKSKKIILIGGKNGNGKTTVFEAIRLCLYGPLVLEKRSTKDSYKKFLIGKIHYDSNNLQQATKASVGLEFQHAHLGKIDTYLIFRRWENIDNNFSESFEIKKNGKILSEIDSEQWQDFINDLIPPGLSQLFFFDGEKIQALAEDMSDNKQLSDSFKALLGVDLIEKLRSDLEIYSIKQLKQNGAKDLQKRILSIQEEDKKFELMIDVQIQERAQLQSKIDQSIADIERQEYLLKKEGGVFAQKRDDMMIERSKVEAEISLVEGQLRDFCGDLLPFVFAQKLSNRLRHTLLQEEEVRNETITQNNIRKKLTKLKSEISKDIFWNKTSVTNKEAKSISNNIFKNISNVLISKTDNNKIIHNLSSDNHNQILSLIDRAKTEAPDKLLFLTKKHNQLIKKQHKLGKEISFAPSDSAISNKVTKCNELHHKLGTLQQSMQSKDEEIKKLKFAHEQITRNLRKLFEEMKSKENLSNRLKMVTKVQSALEEYHGTLEVEKIKEFSKLFLESYNQIARKKNVFEKIKVDPKDYSVTLHKKGNKKIPKSQLSAGEKQIYAIAVLWTLTKISRRPLPFIIDTPLGRLDLDHGENLIQNFFPKASHQLIILSTDTEVDKKYMDQLKPEITRTYNLNYKNGKTNIEEGYFWDKK
jgi:DNA sulfur modification protein DndD